MKQMDFIGKVSDSSIIYDNVRIGSSVTICDKVIIYSNVEIEAGVFIGPGCILGEPVMDFYQKNEGFQNPLLIIGKNSIIRSNTVIYAGSELGENLQTGHNVTIREHTKIGRNCSIGSYSDIQGFVEIGNYCRFHSSVHIAQYSKIKNYVFMFPNSILTNDPHPPSDTCTKGPILEDYSVVSAGAVVLPGLTIGHDSIIGANSLVNKDVEPEKVILGNPGRPISSINDLKCKNGRIDKLYPWKERFSRGMPWDYE